MEERKYTKPFRVVLWLIRTFYPRMQVVGAENLPQEPAIIVSNHAQMHGPIACELYFPAKRYTWCAGEMMHLKDVPAYAYRDFWSGKPKGVRWLYKGLSYLIAPLSVYIFGHARTIEVQRDARILSTFRETLARLQEGAGVVIFPEKDVPHNQIIYEFQEGFVDVARMYHRKTGTELPFVPMYIAPDLKKMVIGVPVRYCASNPIPQERSRICAAMMAEITRMAEALPRHRVVPYRNLPKKEYPYNLPAEVQDNEKACS